MTHTGQMSSCLQKKRCLGKIQDIGHVHGHVEDMSRTCETKVTDDPCDDIDDQEQLAGSNTYQGSSWGAIPGDDKVDTVTTMMTDDPK